MENEENAANEENADNLLVTARLLPYPKEEPEAFITIVPSLDEPERMDTTIISRDQCGYRDELVDVTGDAGEFACVPLSGLPLTSETQKERENQKHHSEIPSIAKQMSMNGTGHPSLTNVEFVSAVSVKAHRKHGLSDDKKHALGICLIMIHCVTLVGANQFARASYTTDFSAPFLLIYLRTAVRISIFPLFMVLRYVHHVLQHKGDEGGRVSFMKTYKSCQSVFGPQGLTVKTFLHPCGWIAILWLIAQFTQVFAVKYLNNSIVQALLCAETAFCYILSALILKVPVYAVKVSAVIVALAGVSLMAFSTAADGLQWEGVPIALSGAFLSSVYMVSVKKTLGKSEDVGQSLLLTSVMSIFVTVTCCPVVILLYYTGLEYWSLETFPWGAVWASSTLALVSVCVFNWAMILTNPLLLTLSKLMGIPVNFGIDKLFWKYTFNFYQIFGVILIGLGFVFIALPERILGIHFLARKIRRHAPSSTAPAFGVPTTSSGETKSHI